MALQAIGFSAWHVMDTDEKADLDPVDADLILRADEGSLRIQYATSHLLAATRLVGQVAPDDANSDIDGPSPGFGDTWHGGETACLVGPGCCVETPCDATAIVGYGGATMVGMEEAADQEIGELMFRAIHSQARSLGAMPRMNWYWDEGAPQPSDCSQTPKPQTRRCANLHTESAFAQKELFTYDVNVHDYGLIPFTPKVKALQYDFRSDTGVDIRRDGVVSKGAFIVPEWDILVDGVLTTQAIVDQLQVFADDTSAASLDAGVRQGFLWPQPVGGASMTSVGSAS